MINKIGIIGLGLIGGSLAKVIKSRNIANQIVAFNRNPTPLIEAYNDKIIDEYTSEINEIFKSCNIIFICTPVDKITQYIEKLMPYIDENCILTDVGSTKLSIYEKMKTFNVNFIGGHPMAGSEKTGYSASKDFLFENAFYVLTPMPNISLEQYSLLETFVNNIGSIPIKMDPVVHDHVVATISHVPHIIASTLVNCVKDLDKDNYMFTLAAGGFKDITRIASASPDIWNSISIENKYEITKVLNLFKLNIEQFLKQLENPTNEIYDFFEKAKNYRDSFSSISKSGYFKVHEIKVDVVDKPGIIATVATMLSVNSINIKNIGIVNNREFENGVMTISFENHEELKKSVELLKSMNFVVYNAN